MVLRTVRAAVSSQLTTAQGTYHLSHTAQGDPELLVSIPNLQQPEGQLRLTHLAKMLAGDGSLASC